MKDTTRRQFIAIGATGSLTALAGCAGGLIRSQPTVNTASAIGALNTARNPTEARISAFFATETAPDADTAWTTDRGRSYLADTTVEKERTVHDATTTETGDQLALRLTTTADTAGAYSSIIGTTVGAYISALRNGATLPPLAVTAQTPGGDTIGTWRVPREMAADAGTGRISEERVVRVALSTVSTA